jgi:hypothetical protein
MKSVEFCAAQVTAPKFHSIVRYAHRESRHPDTRLPSGLPENEEDGRLGEARRVTLAVVDMADNVRGELSPHVITVSKLNGKKIARPIECVGHDAQSLGIINMLDAARCSHLQRAKIDWPLLRPCATTWAIMRQHEPLITDCAQDTVYLPINPCLSATCGADVPRMLIARADKVIE